MEVVYEDNHIIIVSKRSGEIVQGDKTGDEPLSETVKRYIKAKYGKPGNVFLGVVHRLDRPVWGLVCFARTSKALERLNRMFANGEVHKTYWAIVGNERLNIKDERLSMKDERLKINDETNDEPWTSLTHWIVRNEKQNKSYAYDHEVPHSKEARLRYRVIGHGERYSLVEVELLTGRHHQIRCQLSAIGCPIKGDLKYGARRSNPDGSISLLSRRMEFVHPVSHKPISVVAPLPDDRLWHEMRKEE